MTIIFLFCLCCLLAAVLGSAVSELPPMPLYLISFNLSNADLIIFRIYDNYGDGSSTGWKEAVPKPTVTLKSPSQSVPVPLKVIVDFRYYLR